MTLLGKSITQTYCCRHVFQKCGFNTPLFRRRFQEFSSSSDSSYTVEEIKVPNGPLYGYEIACKVWKGTGSPSSAGEPPIICVHGWLDNAGSFDALIPKLMRPGRTFYAFDLPGHGFSSHIKTTHYNNHTEAHLYVHRIVRHLKLDKFNLLGHSMGAKGCIVYAATFPDGVEKIVCVDAVNPRPPTLADWVWVTKAFAQGIHDVEDVMAKSPDSAPRPYDELLQRMINARKGMTVTEEGCRILLKRGAVEVPGTNGMYRFTHDFKLRLLPGLAWMLPELFAQFCAVLKAKVCLIKAKDSGPMSLPAADDFQLSFDMGKTKNNDLQVEFHLVEGNHHVHLNDPDKVAHIIMKFLDS